MSEQWTPERIAAARADIERASLIETLNAALDHIEIQQAELEEARWIIAVLRRMQQGDWDELRAAIAAYDAARAGQGGDE